MTVKVCDDRDVVERDLRDLRERRICCPACAAGLAPWGHGRARLVRGMAWAEAELAADERWEPFRPRRGRCEACAGTCAAAGVAAARRADTAEVVVSAIEARAAGARPQDIADDLGRPEGTARGVLRITVIASAMRAWSCSLTSVSMRRISSAAG